MAKGGQGQTLPPFSVTLIHHPCTTLCINLAIKLRTSAVPSCASALFSWDPTSALKKILPRTASKHTTVRACLQDTPRAACDVHETGRKKIFAGFKGKSIPPHLAAYLVEVIFIIRETFEQKATCNRRENHMENSGAGRNRTPDENPMELLATQLGQPQPTHCLGQRPQHQQFHVQQVTKQRPHTGLSYQQSSHTLGWERP